MGMTSSKPYIFRAILEWLEDNEMTPHIAVDIGVEGVLVPLEYANDGQIVLNIASRSIELFSLDNEAIHFSARFNGLAQDIYVPITSIMSIYARENGQGMFFEVEETGETEKAESLKLTDSDKNNDKESKKDHLSVAKKDAKDKQSGDDDDSKPTPPTKPTKSKGKSQKNSKRDSSHLKVIK